MKLIRTIQILYIALGLGLFSHGAIVGFYGLSNGFMQQSLVSIGAGLSGLIFGVLMAWFIGKLGMKKKRDYGQ